MTDEANEISVCVNCVHVRSNHDARSRGSDRPLLCAARLKASKPERVHPVTGETLPEVITLALCHFRNERGECGDFERREDCAPVHGLAADINEDPPPPPAPREIGRGESPFSWGTAALAFGVTLVITIAIVAATGST